MHAYKLCRRDLTAFARWLGDWAVERQAITFWEYRSKMVQI